MAVQVKAAAGRLRGSRVSSKNQVTLPVAVLSRAGIKAGDVVRVEADGPGRIRLTREADPIEEFAGVFTGVFPPGFLEELRAEWDR